MPIDSHEDMFSFAAALRDIGKYLKAIANQENRVNSVRDKLAQEMDQMIRIKKELIRAYDEISKKVEDLDRNKGTESGVDKSKVDSADIEQFKKWMGLLSKENEGHASFSDALKALSFQIKNTIEKMSAFGEGYELLSDALKAFIRADKTHFEKKDKLMSPEKIGAMETAKEEAGRKHDQLKKDIVRRKDEYLKEKEKSQSLLANVADKMKP